MMFRDWMMVGALVPTLLLFGCGGGTEEDNNAENNTAANNTTNNTTANNNTAANNANTACDSSAWGTAASGASWGDNVTVEVDGDTFSFSSDGLPDHDVLEAYGLSDDTTTGVNESPVEFSVPLCPTVADEPTDTGLGAIGFAISGAVFFNPYEGDGSSVALDNNFDVDGAPFIDSCNGHPLPDGSTYHYHGVPYCITDMIDTDGEHSKMLGFLLDGFPIYGPKGEGGEVPTDLDACNAHFGPTPEFPDGVTHYHLSETAPYSIDCYVGEVEAGGGMMGPPGGMMGPPGGGM